MSADFSEEFEFEAGRKFDESRHNMPIITTLVLLALGFVLRQDVITIIALYQFSSTMEANWVLESFHVLARLPFDIVSDYGEAAASNPIFTKACTSAVAYIIGDLMAQVFEGRRKVKWLDLNRCARNGAAGFLLHGPMLHYWILFLEGPVTALIGDGENWSAIAAKIVLDQTVFSAFLNISYALLLGIMAGKGTGEVLRSTRKTIVPAMLSSWRFWPFVHLITYSPIMPIDFKVLWNDVAEIVWVAILSVIANDSKPASLPEKIEPRRNGSVDPQQLPELVPVRTQS